MIVAPTQTLKPGDEGAAVKQLQDWLVQEGFLTQAQMDTGPGIYGPRTKAAVAKFQSESDINTEGYSGYYGPITKNFITSQGDEDSSTSSETSSSNNMGDSTPEDLKTGSTENSNKFSEEDKAGSGIPENFTETVKNTETEEDLELEDLLSNSGMSDSEKDIIRSIYSATSSFDKDLMERLEAGFDAAEKLQEPYFNAQVRLVKDELSRGFQSLDSDLEFKEGSLKRNLESLKEDIEISKSRNSIEEQSQLKQLERSLGEKLETTRQDLAVGGFSSSSRRIRSDELVKETAGEMRESTTRSFAQARQDMDRSEKRGEESTASDIIRLQELASRGKLDLGRSDEKILGSEDSSGLGFTPLGDISGSLIADRQKSMREFASSFVF